LKIAVPADRAQRVIEQVPNRYFSLLARATPITARVGEKYNKLHADLMVDLDLVYIFKRVRQSTLVLTKFQPTATSPNSDVLSTELDVDDSGVDAAATPSTGIEADGTVGSSDPARPTFPADIVGLRLGMSFVEAEAIIQEHMTVGEVLDAKRQPLPDPNLVVPYTSGRLFVSADGMEFIQLFDEPPAARGQVVAVVRWLHRSKGSLGADIALGALTDK